jgi:pimeloyl-ACP methyl ester carboxylesterase
MPDTHVMTLSDGRDLAWLELGDEGGFPVLCFHGTPGSRLQLRLDDAPLRTAGARLVVCDRPGYGLSSFQEGRRLVDWPTDVAQLADHLGLEHFSVMGISGGGPHSAVCAALLGDRVERAAIVSGVAPMSGPEAAEGMMKSNQMIATLARRQPGVLGVLLAAQLGAVRRWPDKVIGLMERQLPAADVDVISRPEIRALFVEDARRTSRTASRAMRQDFELFASPWGFELSEIDVPVHLWQGDEDVNVPPVHAVLQHRAIPGSVLHECPGEGHLLVVDHLVEIVTAITP